MEDPDWAKVLNYLYEERAIEYCDENPLDQSHKIIRNIGLNTDNPKELLEDMREINLIQYDTTHKSDYVLQKYVLDEKGFDVAHEREIKQNQTRNNQAIVILTIVLAFTAITDLAINATIGIGISSDHLILFPIIAIGVFILLAYYMNENDLIPN